MTFFFERDALAQVDLDKMIVEGGIPIYRDPTHPPTHATIVKPEPPQCAVYAHPSMSMFEIAALWQLRTR